MGLLSALPLLAWDFGSSRWIVAVFPNKRVWGSTARPLFLFESCTSRPLDILLSSDEEIVTDCAHTGITMCSHGAHADTQGEPLAVATTARPYPLKAPAPVGKKITSLYKKRLVNFFTPGQWEKVNLMA